MARAAWGCSGGASTLQDPRNRAQPRPCLALAPQPGEDRCPPPPGPHCGWGGREAPLAGVQGWRPPTSLGCPGHLEDSRWAWR